MFYFFTFFQKIFSFLLKFSIIISVVTQFLSFFSFFYRNYLLILSVSLNCYLIYKIFIHSCPNKIIDFSFLINSMSLGLSFYFELLFSYNDFLLYLGTNFYSFIQKQLVSLIFVNQLINSSSILDSILNLTNMHQVSFKVLKGLSNKLDIFNTDIVNIYKEISCINHSLDDILKTQKDHYSLSVSKFEANINFLKSLDVNYGLLNSKYENISQLFSIIDSKFNILEDDFNLLQQKLDILNNNLCSNTFMNTSELKEIKKSSYLEFDETFAPFSLLKK